MILTIILNRKVQIELVRQISLIVILINIVLVVFILILLLQLLN